MFCIFSWQKEKDKKESICMTLNEFVKAICTKSFAQFMSMWSRRLRAMRHSYVEFNRRNRISKGKLMRVKLCCDFERLARGFGRSGYWVSNSIQNMKIVLLYLVMTMIDRLIVRLKWLNVLFLFFCSFDNANRNFASMM